MKEIQFSIITLGSKKSPHFVLCVTQDIGEDETKVIAVHSSKSESYIHRKMKSDLYKRTVSTV